MSNVYSAINEALLKAGYGQGHGSPTQREIHAHNTERETRTREAATVKTAMADIVPGLRYIQRQLLRTTEGAFSSSPFKFVPKDQPRAEGEPLQFELTLGRANNSSAWRNAVLTVHGRDANVVAIEHRNGVSAANESTRVAVDYATNPKAGERLMAQVATLASEGPDIPQRKATIVAAASAAM